MPISLSDTRRRCEAMIAAGIEDPDSLEGKHFCTENCPYPDGCVVYEYKPGKSPAAERKVARVARAKEMRGSGVDIAVIALELGVSLRTVERYLL